MNDTITTAYCTVCWWKEKFYSRLVFNPQKSRSNDGYLTVCYDNQMKPKKNKFKKKNRGNFETLKKEKQLHKQTKNYYNFRTGTLFEASTF